MRSRRSFAHSPSPCRRSATSSSRSSSGDRARRALDAGCSISSQAVWRARRSAASACFRPSRRPCSEHAGPNAPQEGHGRSVDRASTGHQPQRSPTTRASTRRPGATAATAPKATQPTSRPRPAPAGARSERTLLHARRRALTPAGPAEPSIGASCRLRSLWHPRPTPPPSLRPARPPVTPRRRHQRAHRVSAHLERLPLPPRPLQVPPRLANGSSPSPAVAKTPSTRVAISGARAGSRAPIDDEGR